MNKIYKIDPYSVKDFYSIYSEKETKLRYSSIVSDSHSDPIFIYFINYNFDYVNYIKLYYIKN